MTDQAVRKPLLHTYRLRRLPFQRRPMAEPGTTLVFQTRSGQYTWPRHPYTAGDLWWRGPREAYVVDVTQHSYSFQCELPCAGDALHFDATIGFKWSVHDAATVVQERVTDAPADCQTYLVREMRAISRRFHSLNSAGAERAVLDELASARVLGNGLRISELSAELRLDPAQAGTAARRDLHALEQRVAEEAAIGKDRIDGIVQSGDLERHQERLRFFTDMFNRGGTTMVANILAQDPTRAAEAAQFMVGMWQQDQQVALDAMKIAIDGEQIRDGELDGAVAAVVDRFTAIVARAGAQLPAGRPGTSEGDQPAALAPATGGPAEPGSGDGDR